jgi:hypothetical protein
MQLSTYTPVPSGMSFDLDTGPAPRMAYLLSTPGNEATVALQGEGVWTVEILASLDGVDFTPVALQTLPGQWRYNTKGAAAAALRVLDFESGRITGMLAHGGLTPVTYVSPLFGSYLSYAFRTGVTEPPAKAEVKFNSTLLPNVTKVWIDNDSEDGSDQFYALRAIPPGGVLLLQERDNHLVAVLLTIVGPVLDKVGYIEVPVVYQEHSGSLSPQSKTPILLAAFNPGAALTLVPTRLADRLDKLDPEKPGG